MKNVMPIIEKHIIINAIIITLFYGLIRHHGEMSLVCCSSPRPLGQSPADVCDVAAICHRLL